MSFPDQLHLKFHQKGQSFNLNLVRGNKSPHAVKINKQFYEVHCKQRKIEKACALLNSFSLEAVGSEEELKGRLTEKGVSFDTKKTYQTGTTSLGMRPSKWLLEEEETTPILGKQVAEAYWDKRASDEHGRVLGYLKGRFPEIVPALEEALLGKDKMAFVSLFQTIPRHFIDDIDGFMQLGVFPDCTFVGLREPIQAKQDLKPYMGAIGFSGVVCSHTGDKALELNTPTISSMDAPMNIQSQGKVFTGVLMMLLIKQGLIEEGAIKRPLQLDESVIKALEEQGISREQLSKITLEQVMQHTSGLGDYLGNYLNAIKSMNPPPIVEKPEDLLQYAAADIVELEPGQERYSNLGSLLFGLSIQHLYNSRNDREGSPLPYNEILRRYVIRPAGLTSFSETRPEGAHSDLQDPNTYAYGTPAGGYWCSARDLDRFGTWLSKEYRAENPEDERSLHNLFEKYGREFCSDKGVVEHTGANSMGSSHIAFYLDQDTSVVVLSDQERLRGDIAANTLYFEAIRRNILYEYSMDVSAVRNAMEKSVPEGAGAMLAFSEKGKIGSMFIGKTHLNGSQVDGQTAALIGSGAKMFTAFLSMVLSEKGLISLDSKLCDFMTDEQMHIFQDREKAREITLGMLLSHTSGLQYYADDNNKERKGMSLDEIIKGMPSGGIRFIANPGDHIYSYSNQIELAALMIEKAYRQKTGSTLDYAGIMEKELLQPLGMTRTGFDKPQDDNVLQCYVQGKSKQDEVLDPLMRGAGGLWSCMDDMMKLAAAYREDGLCTPSGEALISSEGVQKMAEKQGVNGNTGLGINRNGDVIGKGGSIYTYAFNFQVNPQEGNALISFYNFANENISAKEFAANEDQIFAMLEPSLKKAAEVPARKAKHRVLISECDLLFKGDRGLVGIQRISKDPGLRVNWNGQTLALQKIDSHRYLIVDEGYPHGQIIQMIKGEKTGTEYLIIEKSGETNAFQSVGKSSVFLGDTTSLMEQLQAAEGDYPSIKAPGFHFHFRVVNGRPQFTINTFPFVDGLIINAVKEKDQVNEVWFQANCADFPPDKMFKIIRGDEGRWLLQVTDFINPDNINETLTAL